MNLQVRVRMLLEVLEAKVRALVTMIKKYQPDCTLEQAKETISRWIEDEWKKANKK